MKYKKYPEYKDSGVEWLGDIPKNWNIKRLKYILSLNPSKSELKNIQNDTIVTFLPMTCVSENGEIDLDSQCEYENVKSGFTYFKNNDVIVAKITPCFENGKGALVKNLSNGIGFGSTEFHVLRVSTVLDSKFLYYLTHSYPFKKMGEAMMLGAAGQKRLPEDFIANLTIGISQKSEQQAIVDFLDKETSRLDGLIDKNICLIELLKEKRLAIINRAVTKGIDKNAKLKPSDIEWLNEIPTNWKVFPAFAVLQEQQLSNKGMKETNLLSLSYGNIIRKDIEATFGLLPESFETYQIVHKGNLILRLTDLQNDKRSLRVGLVKETGIITSAYLGIKPSEELVSDYVFFLLHLYDLQKVFYNMGGGVRQSLKYAEFKWLPILLPSKEEQVKIVNFINEKTSKIDTSISKIEQLIEKLKEYKQTLISNAVTGKIDVRDCA